MPQFNRAKREVTVKVVYYGPGMSGKTTNIMALHERYPEEMKGSLVRLDTEQERTLFFDYFPGRLNSVRGFSVRVDYFTVPGQSYYSLTRRTVLKGADGVVFVADSDPRREEANLIAHRNMIENFKALGMSLNDMPIVYQWNKRDVRNPLPVSMLEEQLNWRKAPSFEANARDGVGVWETEREILTQTLRSLRRNVGGQVQGVA